MSIVDFFLEKGILISSEIINNPLLKEKLSKLKEKDLENIDFIDKEFLEKKQLLLKIDDLPKQTKEEPITKKEEDDKPNINNDFKDRRVKIVFSYDKKPKKISVNDFVSHLNKRFNKLSSFLRQRTEMQNTISISRIKNKKDKERVSIIGIVYDKSITKTGKIVINLEDPTDKITIIISDKNKEAFEQAKNIVLDEVIGVEGVIFGTAVFVNKIIFPDIPFTTELKKSPVDESLAIVGDPHFGSKLFLKKEFEDFIEWINQRKGNEKQKFLASKIKYLIFPGDLVEGVGIYPNQEQDLKIKDIKKQYDIMAEYLKKIPSYITIIIIPGNHDVGRIAEPQLPLTHYYAENVKQLSNVLLVSNPSLINIGAQEDFSGFNILIYHGYSLIYYANNIESIRNAGGQKRPDLIMQALLKKRHLAPSHTSNLYVPDTESDPLVIENIPDFFITGHIHRVSVTNYKNITLINGSCWTDITEDQEKRGLAPQPAKIPIINLKTREVKIINFFKKKIDVNKEKGKGES